MPSHASLIDLHFLANFESIFFCQIDVGKKNLLKISRLPQSFCRDDNLLFEILTLSHFGFKYCSVHCVMNYEIVLGDRHLHCMLVIVNNPN